jgi:TPR repeat protein
MESANYIPDDTLDAFAKKDYELVLRLAMPHAVIGNSDAQTTVALLYQCGLGVERDVLAAERWLLKAAEQNNPVAWHSLGTLYAIGYPELQHHSRDVSKCYEKAKELGLKVADPYPPPFCLDSP